MSKRDEPEVLVVGAGPVGMLHALLLARNGVRVAIIDKEERPAAHSYACALHPATIEVLARAGLAEPILRAGQRLETVAFYEGLDRQLEIDVSKLSTEFPFLLVLPQDQLEEVLQEALRELKGVRILWNHRLATLEQTEEAVVARIDKLCLGSKGYAVASHEWAVAKRIQLTVPYLVGTDGSSSQVRNLLGIPFAQVSPSEVFAVYEFQAAASDPQEARVVLNETDSNVFWPLPGGRGRCSLQLPARPSVDSEHTKERVSIQIVNPEADKMFRWHVGQFIHQRAPWFGVGLEEIEWSAVVEFQGRLADSFGNNRSWLAGDAAHQTSPLGMQSMNVGLQEAARLAAAITNALREGGSTGGLEAYGRESREEWVRLLGLERKLTPLRKVKKWTAAHASRLLPCMPASGPQLVQFARQLGLGFAP